MGDRDKNTPSVAGSWNAISGSLLFLFTEFVKIELPVSLASSIFDKDVATGSNPEMTTPVLVISTSVIFSPVADDLREEFERELPRDPCPDTDCDPDLANRGRRGLVVDGAGRSSGIGVSCSGNNFERILLDLRIDKP